jgi:hypothetical protein
MNIEKLMESLRGGRGNATGADLNEEDYFGVIPFDTQV